MKVLNNLLATLTLLIFMATPLNSLAEEQSGKIIQIKGSSPTVERCVTLDLSAVNHISVENGIDVVVVPAGDEPNKICYTINKNLEENFILEVKNNTLKISLEGRNTIYRNVNIKLEVPYNALFNSFEASAAASISSQVDIIAPSLKIHSDAASKVKIAAAIEGDCRVKSEAASKVELIAKVGGSCYLDVDAASKAEVTISAVALYASIEAMSKVVAEGWVDRLEVDAEALSKFEGKQLRCTHGKLQAESLSKITYSSNNTLKSSKEALSSITNVK